ncbi:MAG: electron transport complex subunit E [Clostridia bacterium]|nr:electron transport complex subunit E [Clostridia bacterium]
MRKNNKTSPAKAEPVSNTGAEESSSESVEKKEKKLTFRDQLLDGLLYKNPVFVQLLGLCSVLAITTTVKNAIGMGAAVTAVLIFSNLLISLLRKFIPNQVRIASYIVVIAGFVSVVELLMKAYLPSLDKSLGVFIPLIVVNCIILARAESFASKNGPVKSILDGFTMGLGYTVAVVVFSVIREILGSGSIFDIRLFGDKFQPMLMAILPPGGFIILGCLIALTQWLFNRKGDK